MQDLKELEKKKTSGPLARKQLVVAVLNNAGADRATAAYDALQAKDANALHQLIDSTKADQLARPLQRLLARHKISWTKDHYARTHGNNNADSSAAATTGSGVTPTIALDPADWNVKVVAAPEKDDADGTYLSSVSLHDNVTADQWCQAISQQDKAIAILAIGYPGNPVYAHKMIQIPVLKLLPGTTKPKKTFEPGVIYQRSIKDEVICQTNIAKLQEDKEAPAWMRITIHEAEALKDNPSITELFDQQFSGAAPVLDKTKKEGTAVERYKQQRRSDAKIQLDDQLRDALGAILQRTLVTIPIIEPPTRLTRMGATKGQRTITATFAVAHDVGDRILAASGAQGITYHYSYIGNSDQAVKDKERIDTIWYPNRREQALQAAYALSVKHRALGAVIGDRSYIGVRVLHGTQAASDLSMEIRGVTSTLPRKKWRIEHIPHNWATRQQVKKAATTIGWQDVEVVELRYQPRERMHMAIVRADADPPNQYWQVEEGQPWIVSAVEERAAAAAAAVAPEVVLAAALADQAEAAEAAPTKRTRIPTKTPPAPKAPPTPAPTAACATPSWLAKVGPATPGAKPTTQINGLSPGQGGPAPTPAGSNSAGSSPSASTQASSPTISTSNVSDATAVRIAAVEQAHKAQITALEQKFTHFQQQTDGSIATINGRLDTQATALASNTTAVTSLSEQLSPQQAQLSRMEQLLLSLTGGGPPPPPPNPQQAIAAAALLAVEHQEDEASFGPAASGGKGARQEPCGETQQSA